MQFRHGTCRRLAFAGERLFQQGWAAMKVMCNSALISELILKGAVEALRSVMEKSRLEGMQTFDPARFDLYECGALSGGLALRHPDVVNDLR